MNEKHHMKFIISNPFGSSIVRKKLSRCKDFKNNSLCKYYYQNFMNKFIGSNLNKLKKIFHWRIDKIIIIIQRKF